MVCFRNLSIIVVVMKNLFNEELRIKNEESLFE